MQTAKYSLIRVMVALVFTAAAISSCIKNDTPSPTVKGAVLEFEAEGQNRVAIDPAARTVTVDLKETVNLAKVKITRLVLPETAECPLKEGMEIDLTAPLKVTVKTAAGYEWTVSATQTIERRFVIGNQIGDAYFEAGSRNVFAFVPKGTDLTRIHVIDLKLGPEGFTVMTPDLREIGTVSFRATGQGDKEKVREVEVKYHGKTETWSLFVTETDTRLNSVHAFAKCAYLTGSGLEGNENGFEYRKNEEGTEWIRVPDADVEHIKGVFKTCLKGLEPETEYAVRAFSGENTGYVELFTTEGTPQLPNGGFEEYQVNNKVHNFYLGDVANKFWDSGNQGSTTLGESVTQSYADARPGSDGTRCVQLKSRFVGFGPLGKFAAASIYTGEYAGTSGTNGKVNFGRAFPARPSALTVWFKASPGKVDYAGSGAGLVRGDTDKYQIFIALTDWSGPHQVYTGDQSTFINWDTNRGVIAYGSLDDSNTVGDWTKATIDLKYRSLDRTPTHLIISACASMYGDYFTGSSSSTMYVDDFELVYGENIVLQD